MLLSRARTNITDRCGLCVCAETGRAHPHEWPLTCLSACPINVFLDNIPHFPCKSQRKCRE